MQLVLSEVRCVNGKFDILYTLADTALENPNGVIQETIYPKVSQETLGDLTKELISNKNTWYQHQVQKKMRSCYSHAHRRILLMLLEIFTFQTNNQDGKEILQAIEFIVPLWEKNPALAVRRFNINFKYLIKKR